MNEKTIYQIIDMEAGNIIEECDSLIEAEKKLELYEKEDRQNGEYTENFYEIVEVTIR